LQTLDLKIKLMLRADITYPQFRFVFGFIKWRCLM